jgi:cytochrome b involved in lipid metabolism
LNLAYYLLILILITGKDATEAFEDVGHSDEARALLPGMLVGEFEKDGVRIMSTCLPLYDFSDCSFPQQLKIKSSSSSSAAHAVEKTVETTSR